MAEAPRPGASTRKAAIAEAQRLITIKITRPTFRQDPRLPEDRRRQLPESHSIAINNLPMRERIICRKATGLPLGAFWAGDDRIDLDSLMVLWWMARRLNGEANLTFDQAIEDWPNDLDIATELDVEVSGDDEDLDVTENVEGDDPEA